MRDLELYRRLALPDCGREVLPALVELRALPLTQRAAYFSRLLDHRRHRDADVRAAVIGALAGGNGYDAVVAMVAALDDDHSDVRDAAVDALAMTALRSPMRIAHAFFHDTLDVRRRALEVSKRPPGALAVHLISDPALADIVEARADTLLGDGSAVLAVLDLHAARYIDEERARRVLRRAPWGERLVSILDGLPRESERPDTTAEMPLQLMAQMKRRVRDRIDDVVRLLIDDDEFIEHLATAVASRSLGGESRLRLAWSLTRVIVGQGSGSVTAIAIAAIPIPALLAYRDLPLVIRKRAAALLPDLSPVPLFNDPLQTLFSDPVCLDDGIDLPVVTGILALAKPPGIQAIATHGEISQWVSAIRRYPREGMRLLAEPPPGKFAKVYREVIAALLVGVRENLDLVIDLIATVANVRSELAALEAAARTDRELCVLLLDGARRRDEDRTLTNKPKRRQRLIAWLARLLDHAQVDGLFIRVSSQPESDGDWIDGEVLSAGVRLRDASDVATRVAAFSSQNQLGVLRWIANAGHFPSGAYYAIVGRLSASPDPVIRAAAQKMSEPVRDVDRTAFVEAGDMRPLTDEEVDRIQTCDEVDLPGVLELVYENAVHGVARALLSRRAPTSSVAVCAAVLFAYDEPSEVCDAFERFMDDEPSFLSELDSEMVARGRMAKRVPPLAGAWLHKWERPLSSFEASIMHHIEAIADVLTASVDWSSPILIDQVWRGVARVAGIWRMRFPKRFLDYLNEATGTIVASMIHEYGASASSILLDMFLGGVEESVMGRLMAIVIERLDRVDDATRETLNRWFDTRGVAAPEEEAQEPPDETQTEEAMTSSDPDRLVVLAAMDDVVVAKAALRNLERMGSAAVLDTVVEAARGPVVHGRLWAETLIVLAPESDPRLEELANDDVVSPALRFELGAWRIDAGDLAWWPAVARAICAPCDQRWLRTADLERLEIAGIDPRRLGVDLVTSDQHPAYTKVVGLLTAMASDEEIRAALRLFLDQGTNRLGASRIAAARRLVLVGDDHGLPVVLREAIERWDRDGGPKPGFAFLKFVPWTAAEVAASVMSAGVNGNTNGLLSEIGQLGPAHQPEREAALMAVLRQADAKSTQEAALRSLPRTGTTQLKIRQLANVFAWGARESRLLLNSAYRVHLVGGDAYGYTRLEQRSIFVNPMAFLRGERGGEDVLRGLIVHELGHHVFHADKASLAIWREAEQQRRHGLLNLVADEHLERNLRARTQAHGDHLKVLAAYAFQHADRGVAVLDLMRMLGPQTFEVLRAAKLGVSRSAIKVEVELGQLFMELERSGSSFVRFVRALRMGLGNRHDDPKVAEALALFKGATFRESDMAGLWTITQKLIDIFGEDARLMELMDLHANTSGELTGEAVDGPGIDDESIQREVDRILDGGSKKTENPSRSINRGANESFDEIKDIHRVEKNPAAHREGVARIMRSARRLRDVLTVLGLQLEPRRGRIRGRSIDRAGLPRAVIRRDPRMLIAREQVARADLFLGVVIDCSGSMSLNQNLEKAKLFGLLLSEACRGLRGVDARFWGFTDTKIFDAGTAEQCAVSGLTVHGGNNDAAALWHASRVAKKSQRRAKILVMISDGSPTECTVAALRALVKQLETKDGFVCAQVAVRELQETCFSHHVDLLDDDLDRAVRRFGQVISRLVRSALG